MCRNLAEFKNCVTQIVSHIFCYLCGLKTDFDSHLNLGFGSVFTENHSFGFKTDPALVKTPASEGWKMA